MEIHINQIDPFYDEGMRWTRADVGFRFYPYPEHPSNPLVTVQTLILVPGDPRETFAAFQARALQAAYDILERVLSDRRDVVPQRESLLQQNAKDEP
jgi:hypothetical protein